MPIHQDHGKIEHIKGFYTAADCDLISKKDRYFINIKLKEIITIHYESTSNFFPVRHTRDKGGREWKRKYHEQ
jgi:hypothetical protein